MIPKPIRLFHITAIDNLDAICQSGAIICKNVCADKGAVYHNIAHSGAQGSRAGRAVPNPPGGTIHDFVPFYFAPRSPMLYAIHMGNVEGCTYSQTDIVHVETTVDIVNADGREIVFYDRNATYNYSKASTDVNEIATAVAWDLITEVPRLDGYCKYFQDALSNPRYTDRLEKRMAEFLVKQAVPLDCITRIGVATEPNAAIVRAVLQQNNVSLQVDVMTDWYFLGQ